MPPTRISNAKYTLRQIWLYTYENYRNRFEYRDRDVLKSIVINDIKSYKKDRLDSPTKKFEVRTSSYPKYKPYSEIKGKDSKKQRKVKHNYDLVFQFDRLDWNSPFRWRVGSQRKYPEDKSINYNNIKQLNNPIKEKLEKKYGKGTKEYKKAVERHKRTAKYLDKGDYISQEYGIMADWYFRIQGLAYRSGNLYGLAWITEPSDLRYKVPFFDKHSLRVVQYLLTKGIVKKF